MIVENLLVNEAHIERSATCFRWRNEKTVDDDDLSRIKKQKKRTNKESVNCSSARKKLIVVFHHSKAEICHETSAACMLFIFHAAENDDSAQYGLQIMIGATNKKKLANHRGWIHKRQMVQQREIYWKLNSDR